MGGLGEGFEVSSVADTWFWSVLWRCVISGAHVCLCCVCLAAELAACAYAMFAVSPLLLL